MWQVFYSYTSFQNSVSCSLSISCSWQLLISLAKVFWAPKSNISFLGATRKERHDLTHRFGVLEEPLTLCATLCLLTTFYIPSCEARLCKLWLTSPKMIGTLIKKNIESLPLEYVLVWKIRLKNNVAFWVKAKFIISNEIIHSITNSDYMWCSFARFPLYTNSICVSKEKNGSACDLVRAAC